MHLDFRHLRTNDDVTSGDECTTTLTSISAYVRSLYAVFRVILEDLAAEHVVCVLQLY
jgi:DNA-binding FrmR family transcriptional regulator